MKELQVSMLDIFAYLVPGALLVVAVIMPLCAFELLPWPSLGLGESVIAAILFYACGVLASTTRPFRFRGSTTGTTEDAYDVECADKQVCLEIAAAVHHFLGADIDVKPWSKEKHFAARFIVEQRHDETGRFIRRQSAIRQLRYNCVVPVLALTLGGTLVVIRMAFLYTGVYILAVVALPILCGGIVKQLYRAARGNIHREVLYVQCALVAMHRLDLLAEPPLGGNGHGRTTIGEPSAVLPIGSSQGKA